MKLKIVTLALAFAAVPASAAMGTTDIPTFAGQADDLAAGVEKAGEALASGAAGEVLENLVARSRDLAGAAS